ncbi:hypothetical protein L6452_32533 [Arctium lappa]|uniref:Uncharacterized protein n=1 Tax=Arctium lappa TaxID=4217 RepID=A0ACB8Z5R0_ARCLA|nr:hypothetical protein L6452_32533 [Arctium lappa]
MPRLVPRLREAGDLRRNLLTHGDIVDVLDLRSREVSWWFKPSSMVIQVLGVMIGVWGLCHFGAMPWLYPRVKPLVIFLILFAKVPDGGFGPSSPMKQMRLIIHECKYLAKSSAVWR